MEPALSKEQYQRLTDHFERCSGLPAPERDRYLVRLTSEDPEVGRNLQSLLRHHRPESPPAPPPAEHRPTRPRRVHPGAALRILLITGVVIAGVVVIGQWWALGRLEEGLKREAALGLRSALDLRIDGFRRWACEKKRHVRRILEDPALGAPIAALANDAGDPAPVIDHMRRGLGPSGDLGFAILSPAGVAICSDAKERIGLRVGPEGARYLRRILLDDWILSRPQPASELFGGGTGDATRPVLFVGGPIRAPGGGVIAIGLVFFAAEPFYDFLKAPALEFLAFDGDALLLNDLGRTEPLRAAGLLPAGAGSAFRIRLRDPGADLGRGAKPDPPDKWPLTLMAQSGVHGIDGVDTTGRRDLRGEPVLQAWSWLPDLEMGIGVQRTEEDALAALAPIQASLLVTVAVFLAAAVGVAILALRERARLKAQGASPFGSYLLDRRIGRGATADIFLANHAYLKRPAALKILNELDPSPRAVERFEREAQLASRLGHPNTVRVFDYGAAPDGRLYLAMEYVEGLNLGQLAVLENPLPVARVVHLLKQVAGALDEAHQLGLIHRDLKPSNIMIGAKGEVGDIVKVLDFGIATQASDEDPESGGVVGTPAYIAPERIRSPRQLDARSDIYSFGAVAFHLLTGRTVFEGEGTAELVYQVLASARPSPSQLRGERLPEELETLVLDCLSISPSSRPPTFRSVREKLKAIRLPVRWGRDEARAWWAVNNERVARFIQATV
jgi:tRNA A-37 threonylcarbamoyl transferase component Bud32